MATAVYHGAVFSACVVVLLALSVHIQHVTSQFTQATRNESSPKVHYGTFNTTSLTLDPSKNTGCLLKTIVFYPIAPTKSFQPIFFIGGVSGTIPSEAYSELLASIASAGYVVMGINRLNVLDTSPTSRDPALAGPQTFADQMNWLIDLFHNSTTRPKDLMPSFNKTSLLCHSEGCDLMLQILDGGLGGVGNFTKSVMYLDPFSVASTKLPKVAVQIPSLSYVSALSEHFPPCCIKGLGYRQFYKLMPCQKVKMDIAGFGHCDLLDPKWWEVCHVSHVCVTTNSSRLADYRMFLQREVTSFIRWAVDGDASQLKYFTDKSYIPFPVLDLDYDGTKCVNSTDGLGREQHGDMMHVVPDDNLYDEHALERDILLEK